MSKFFISRLKRYIAELIGTYALVFCGTGAIIIDDVTNGSISNTGIAISFGLIVMSMVYALGKVSGAHINPAVSIAFWVSGLFKTRHLLPYIAAQFMGAIFASLSLKFLFPSHLSLGATLPHSGSIKSFVLEIILTFFLMLVILQVSTGSKKASSIAGIAIGGVVLLEALFAGPISGASMNPFRSLAPALVSGNLETIWVYLTAPTIGALLSVPIWKIFQQSSN